MDWFQNIYGTVISDGHSANTNTFSHLLEVCDGDKRHISPSLQNFQNFQNFVFRTTATSKMERFVIIVNSFQPLTIITKGSIRDVTAVLDPPLILLKTYLFFDSAHFIENIRNNLLNREKFVFPPCSFDKFENITEESLRVSLKNLFYGKCFIIYKKKIINWNIRFKKNH